MLSLTGRLILSLTWQGSWSNVPLSHHPMQHSCGQTVKDQLSEIDPWSSCICPGLQWSNPEHLSLTTVWRLEKVDRYIGNCITLLILSFPPGRSLSTPIGCRLQSSVIRFHFSQVGRHPPPGVLRANWAAKWKLMVPIVDPQVRTGGWWGVGPRFPTTTFTPMAIQTEIPQGAFTPPYWENGRCYSSRTCEFVLLSGWTPFENLIVLPSSSMLPAQFCPWTHQQSLADMLRSASTTSDRYQNQITGWGTFT